MSDSVVYRQMVATDIDAVVETEVDVFPTPWTAEIFAHELDGNDYATYIVAELEEAVIGHVGMWVVLDDCHITNVAVRKELQGQGIGEALMRQAMNLCRNNGVRTMSLEVRTGNKTAQNLYRKLGFEPGGIRKNYYSDDHEDALVMWVELI